MRDREFDPIVQIARDSAVGRLAVAIDRAWLAAWDDSAARGALSRWMAAFNRWPADRRLRIAALTIAWAGLGHAVSLVWLPKYVMSGLPLPWVGLVVVAALTVAAVPGAFTRAWNDKRSQADS